MCGVFVHTFSVAVHCSEDLRFWLLLGDFGFDSGQQVSKYNFIISTISFEETKSEIFPLNNQAKTYPKDIVD